jgi:hypothetical protein
MQFQTLKRDVTQANFETVRRDSEHYFEGVILRDRMGPVWGMLETHLGAPVWPSPAMLSQRVVKVISAFGGIQEGQSLYFSSHTDIHFFAMIWPWGDGLRATLKMGQVRTPRRDALDRPEGLCGE